MQPSETQWQEIEAAWSADRSFEAVRLYRLVTGATVADAYEAVQAYLAKRTPTMPTASAKAVDDRQGDDERVQRYLDSGHARRGELVGHWRNRAGDICVLVLFQREPTPQFELGVFPVEVGNWGHQLNGCSLHLPELEAALAGQRELPGADFAGDVGVTAALRDRLAALRPRPSSPVPASAPSVGVPHWRASRTRLFTLAASVFEDEFLYLPERITPAVWNGVRAAIPGNAAMQEYCDELPAGTLALSAGSEHLERAATPLLWMHCLARCDARAITIGSLDTLFADLAAARVDMSAWTSEVATVWPLWLAVVDVAGRRRELLPWWLRACGAQTDSAIGLLAPHEVRALARRLDVLLAALAEKGALQLSAPDVSAISAVVHAAAEQGRWLVGWEPGT
jgi:hypothetical protein